MKIPEENRAIFLNVHEPIIDRITWEKVQSLHTTRHRRTTVTQEPSVFSGRMKCPDCGGNLNFHFNQNNHDIKFFSCQNHNSGLRKCSSTHYIRLDFLEQVVLYEVHRLACFANEYENDFIKAMVGRSAKVAENERVRKKRELDALLARDKELDMLFERLYEDNVSGKIDDARFAKMAKRYEQEQGEAAGKIKALRLELKKAEGQQIDMEDFLQMVRRYWIANHLTGKGIPTPRGKAKWQTSTIESILINEKYKGSAILQKKFTVDFLSKKMKVNEGEVPQYIVEESHPAIIDPDQWQKVQDEMAVRKAKGRHHNSLSPFSAKLVCGDCGEYYGSKVWHSTDKYRRVIWQCNGKFKGERRCGTPHLTEEDIKRLFLQAVARLTEEREVLLETCVMLRDEYLNTDAIDTECAALTDEMEIVEALTKKLIAENATTAMPQDEYNRKYDALAQRYHTAEEKAEQLQRQKVTKRFQADVMECFMTELMTIDASLPVHYSDRLWLNLVDRVTVYEDGNLGFHFKNGMEITEML